MAKPKGRITRLESVRGLAAALVLLNHARLFANTRFAIFDSFGQEAVILFFLLSGFVIHYSTFGTADSDRGPGKSPTFLRYFVHRFRRIYPLMLLSLLFAYGVQCMVTSSWQPVAWQTLAGNLGMLQDAGALKRGVWFEPFCENAPLWSLSYEWWFYMMFFPLFMLLLTRSAWQKYAVAMISVAGFVTYQAHPNEISLILGYYFIWWGGVEFSREYCTCGRITWHSQLPTFVILTGLSLLWALPVANAVLHHQHIRLGTDPVLQFRHFAMATVFWCGAMIWYKARFTGFDASIGVFALLAPITYALYILHVPTYELAGHFLPSHGRLLQVTVALIVLLPVCYLLEVRLQRQINRWTDNLLIRADLTGRVSALRESNKSYDDLAFTADSAGTAPTRAGRP